jgi:hypothetical protein
MELWFETAGAFLAEIDDSIQRNDFSLSLPTFHSQGFFEADCISPKVPCIHRVLAKPELYEPRG